MEVDGNVLKCVWKLKSKQNEWKKSEVFDEVRTDFGY